MAPASYRFGEFRLDLRDMRLSRAGRPVAIEPKALGVLIHLVEHRRHLVAKRELLDRVWGKAAVGDNSLTRAVAQIRKALGDDPRAPRFLETAHVLGYRFIGEVDEEEDDDENRPDSPAVPRGHEGPPGPSVAVLPFLDLSEARDQEFLCDGLAEEILNALTRLEGLRVASRTSSFVYRQRSLDAREIGRRLGVGAVLEGSVRREGPRVRVTVQLIDSEDGCHRWSERFDHEAGDLFALEDEIALGVAARLRVELAAAPRRTEQRRQPARDAHPLYLEGRYFLGRRSPADLRLAIARFEAAAAADPEWALPHQGLAETFEVLGLWGLAPPHEALGRARASAERALALDGSLIDAHLALADVLFLHYWDWRGAERHLEQARASTPEAGYGRFVLAMFHLAAGRADEAFRMAHLRIESEPGSPLACEQSGAVLVGLGQLDGAVRLLERALALDPELPMAQFWLGFCRAAQGSPAEAVPLVARAAGRGLVVAQSYLPALLARAGQADEARAAVHDLERTAAAVYVSPADRLLARAALGERERCRELFTEAERERCPAFTVYVFAPGFLALAPPWLRAWFAKRRRELTRQIQLARSDEASLPAR